MTLIGLSCARKIQLISKGGLPAKYVQTNLRLSLLFSLQIKDPQATVWVYVRPLRAQGWPATYEVYFSTSTVRKSTSLDEKEERSCPRSVRYKNVAAVSSRQIWKQPTQLPHQRAEELVLWREEVYQERTYRTLYGVLLSISQRSPTEVVCYLVHFE